MLELEIVLFLEISKCWLKSLDINPITYIEQFD